MFKWSGKYRIPREGRTLTALTRCNGRVYVYCGDPETRQKFIEDAEDARFRYRDGVSLRERAPDAIMALNKDHTVNFVGFVGTMAFRWADRLGSGKDNVPLIKVDYRKYVAGCKEYLYSP